MIGDSVGIWVTISKPYINPAGTLVVEFNVCGTKFEREIDGTKILPANDKST